MGEASEDEEDLFPIQVATRRVVSWFKRRGQSADVGEEDSAEQVDESSEVDNDSDGNRPSLLRTFGVSTTQSMRLDKTQYFITLDLNSTS